MLCLYPNQGVEPTRDMNKPNYTLFVNRAEKVAEILVYGYIGDDEGVLAKEFIKELREVEKDYKQINIHINSGGGSVYEGFAIFNAIKNSTANIDTYIDGMAASMGSVIALAGRKCYMSNVAQMMTHRATGFVYGDADQMRQNADVLEKLEASMVDIYAKKTGLSVDAAKAKYMSTGVDRWMTAQEALADKLIDGIYDSTSNIGLTPPKSATEAEMWQSFGQSIQPKNSLIEQTIYII